jgi:hypothetical protein
LGEDAWFCVSDETGLCPTRRHRVSAGAPAVADAATARVWLASAPNETAADAAEACWRNSRRLMGWVFFMGKVRSGGWYRRARSAFAPPRA